VRVAVHLRPPPEPRGSGHHDVGGAVEVDVGHGVLQVVAAPARPIEPRRIRGQILFTSCFKNPTMMARTDRMRAFGYREEFVYCQDIDLWSRMSREVALANLPEFLIRYRLGGDSHRDPKLARDLKSRIARAQLGDLGIDPSPEELLGHHLLRNLSGQRPDAAFIAWARDWLERLVARNAASGRHPEPEFREAAAERWFRLLLAAGPAHWSATAPRGFAAAIPSIAAQLAHTGARFVAATARSLLR